MIREVDAPKAVGALITKEADSMGVMTFRLNKADKATWTDMKFYKNNAIAGGKETQKVQRSGAIVHSSLK